MNRLSLRDLFFIVILSALSLRIAVVESHRYLAQRSVAQRQRQWILQLRGIEERTESKFNGASCACNFVDERYFEVYVSHQDDAKLVDTAQFIADEVRMLGAKQFDRDAIKITDHSCQFLTSTLRTAEGDNLSLILTHCDNSIRFVFIPAWR